MINTSCCLKNHLFFLYQCLIFLLSDSFHPLLLELANQVMECYEFFLFSIADNNAIVTLSPEVSIKSFSSFESEDISSYTAAFISFACHSRQNNY